MAIYAISDLHLSISKPEKSMQEFGKDWKDYEKKLEKNWKQTVNENDTVIISGDISWAMTLEEAKQDFQFIDSLPGKKIIVKGNHDYYFSTLTKMNNFLKNNNFNTIKALFNNSFNIEGYNICGTRGWKYGIDTNVDDSKIMEREIGRLKISLNSIKKENKNQPIIVAMHFPPFFNDIKKVLEEYKVVKCIYGHLHR